jgi:ribosomal protein S4
MVAAGFASSNGDARRQIAGGAFRINGVKVADANALVEISGSDAELRKGNARKRLVVS